MSPESWLPSLILFDGNWDKYLLLIYSVYERDFIEIVPCFEGQRLKIIREPRINGREWTFWHLIQEGPTEEERIPDIRRCERISWPRPIIEHCSESRITMWENLRGRERRICIWYEASKYVVILVKQRNRILFLTGYPVTKPHMERKFRREIEEFRSRAVTSGDPRTPSTRGR